MNRRFGLALSLVVCLAGKASAVQMQARGRLPLESVTTSQGLPNDSISTITTDSRGYVWFGTLDGLSRYDGERFVDYTTDDGLPDRMIWSIAEDRRGGIWIGTRQGAVEMTPSATRGRSLFSRGECTQPLDFVIVGFVESRNIQSGVAHAAENHERAHLEAARQPIHLRAEVSVSIVVVLKDIQRDEQLGGNLVAPTLDAIVRAHRRRRVSRRSSLSETVRSARARMPIQWLSGQARTTKVWPDCRRSAWWMNRRRAAGDTAAEPAALRHRYVGATFPRNWLMREASVAQSARRLCRHRPGGDLQIPSRGDFTLHVE